MWAPDGHHAYCDWTEGGRVSALLQRQPVPSRTGAVHIHGAAVSAGEEDGAYAGGRGAELFEGKWSPRRTWPGEGI